jgi:protein involved in polysaccharide export with SLBB domain
MFIFFVVGCGGKPNNITSREKNITNEQTSDVLLGPGDTIEIKFLYTPDLNELQTIRPDGKIALHLIGEIYIQGKTPSQLRQELTVLYAKELKNYDISVHVRSLSTKRIYIGGEVMRPGFVDTPRRLNIMEALMEAGWVERDTAGLSNVIVIRYKQDKRYDYSININSVLKGNESSLFYLEPYDIVYVPKKKIAKVNLFVDQYIDGIIPDSVFSAFTVWREYLMLRIYRDLRDENDNN